MDNKPLLLLTKVAVIIIFAGSLLISCKDKNSQTKQVEEKDSLTIKIEQLDWKIKEDSKNADLYYQRAKLLLDKGQVSKAFIDISEAMELDTKNLEYYITLSDIYRAMGDYQKASQAASRVTVSEPNNATAFLKLGEIHLLMQDYQRAFLNINHSIEIEQNNPKAYFARALALLEIEDTTNAVIALRVAVDYDPDFFEAYYNLAHVHAIRHDRLAIDYAQAAIDLKPDDLRAIYLLAMFYQEHGEAEKAIPLYERMLKINPEEVYATYNIGYTYMVYLDQPEKSISWFEKAISINPEYIEAYYNLGVAYELMGDIEKARDQFRLTLEKKPNYELAIEGLNRLDKKK